MNRVIGFLADHPGLLVAVVLMLGSLLLLGGVALLMRRASSSLRPLMFVGGFMAIVIAPQLVFHAAQAFGWIPTRDLTATTAPGADLYRLDTAMFAQRDGRFLDRTGVFGAAHDPLLVTDLRARMPNGPFAQAEAAEMAIVPPTSSITVARFTTPALARAAAAAYLSQTTGETPRPGPDGTITVQRAYDVLKVVIADRGVIAWSATDTSSAAAAIAASRLVHRATGLRDSRDATDDFWLYRPLPAVVLVLSLVLIATLYFFRVSAWAGEVVPIGGVTPVTVSALRQRMLEVNALDVPFTITADAHDPTRLFVTWRYADAKWIDVARAHGMRRTHRVVMRLDAAASVVRYYDQSATMDWSAGFDGASLRWSTARGIVFFQSDWERVFGLQIDPSGRLTTALSYTWRFNLQEMKSPLVQVTTRAGWRWRPTLIDGPPWLRWLTH